MVYSEILHVASNKIYEANKEIKPNTPEFDEFQSMTEAQLISKYKFKRIFEPPVKDPIKVIEKGEIEIERNGNTVSFFIQTNDGRYRIDPSFIQNNPTPQQPNHK